MNHVQVQFLGRGYRLACGPGEEERLRDLAEDLAERLNLLDQRFGGEAAGPNRPPEIMLWIMTALTLLDENYDQRAELDYWRQEAKSRAAGDPEPGGQRDQVMAATLQNLAARLEKLAEPE